MTRTARFGAMLPGRQEGVVLFISLIVLVAMTLAGIAVTRSVDTGNMVAGNVAFKQGSIAAGDRGIEAAIAYLKTKAVDGGLNTTRAAEGYYSADAPHPDWTIPSIWTDAVKVPDAFGKTTDAAGNTVSYIIHRLCDKPDVAPDLNCAQSSAESAGAQGSSMSSSATQRKGLPYYFYRISVRVEGPRDTLSILQTNAQVK